MSACPLAAPYMLKSVGIVVLVSAPTPAPTPAPTLGVSALIIGMPAAAIELDLAEFRRANSVSANLDRNRMLVTAKVFGSLLAAFGMQLTPDGLSRVRVIHATGH
ncbi:MAG: hypothetical protein ACLPVY_27615 [Acidimicrobiia bacterium]